MKDLVTYFHDITAIPDEIPDYIYGIVAEGWYAPPNWQVIARYSVNWVSGYHL